MTASAGTAPRTRLGTRPAHLIQPRIMARVFGQAALARPRWERGALLGLLAAAAVLYCWGLDRNGWANSYYSAAVMSGAQDWTAFFYGSSDPANAITVDKPPMSIWVMALSVRLFGLNSWSILLPQAAMGVLTVYLLYVLVRRYLGASTALLAATFMAVTPVSTVMFRYNNPDALLILIMVAAALAVATAIDRQRPWLMILAGALVGAGFLTKQLQIGLILPALAVTYLAFARIPWRRRFLHLGYAAAAASVVAGSWLVAVQTAGPSSRPFIGGSRTNSTLELALGYNGLQRLTGEDLARTTPSGAQLEEWDSGYQRFLQPQFSGQFGWFLPLAAVGLLIAALWLAKRYGSRGARSLLLLAAVWFATSATVLAFMSGMVHPYYSLTAVPPLCVLAAVALAYFLRSKGRVTRIIFAVTLLSLASMAFLTAGRSPSEFPAGAQLLLIGWAVAIALRMVPGAPPALRRASIPLLLACVVLGPAVWSVNTALSPHTGAAVTAGPAIWGVRTDHPDKQQLESILTPGHVALVLGSSPSAALESSLRSIPPSVTWVAAVVGSETAANYQLGLGRAVLPLGGFDGTDPYPTLEQFQALVADGKVGSLVVQDLPPLTLEGKGESARIVAWVRATFPARDGDGAELYLLHQP